MKKSLFLLPGPTPIPPEVQAAMTMPMINHRGPEFPPLQHRLMDKLKQLFGTQHEVIILPTSGTGGLETAVVNFLQPGDHVLSVTTGDFGERFMKEAITFGLNVEELAYEWGEAFQPQDIASRLQADTDKQIKAVLLTHNETSTGVTNPVAEVRAAIGDHPALLMVDAVSSLGSIEMKMDEWGLDIVITGSQKGLMVPPGLAILAVNERAWQKADDGHLPALYLDLKTYRKGLASAKTPYTPALSLWYGLDAALDLLLAEGLEQVYARHIAMGQRIREGVSALGCRVLADPRYASPTVTTILPPEGIKAAALRKNLLQKQVVVAGGQGKMADSAFRIGHVGFYVLWEMEAALQMLKLAIAEEGEKV